MSSNYNFKEVEEGMLKFWEKNKIYPKAKEIAGKLQKRGKEQRSFSSVLAISAVTGAGLDELNELLWKMVKGHKE